MKALWFTREQWWAVMLSVKPDISRAEFDAFWDERQRG